MTTRLVEGVDYTLEDGKMVLTRGFLLRRGHCCNSGCRNCPYRAEAPRGAPFLEILGLPLSRDGERR